VQHSNMTA